MIVQINDNSSIVGLWFKSYNTDNDDCGFEIDTLVHDLFNNYDYSIVRPQSRVFIILKQIIINLCFAKDHCVDGVIIPLNRNYWVKSNSYNPLGFSTDIINVVSILEQVGLIDIYKGSNAKFNHNLEVSRCSIIVPTERLYEKYINSLLGRMKVSPDIAPIYVHEKVDGKRRRAVKYKKYKGTISHSKLVDYYLNTDSLEKIINDYNKMLSQFHFTMAHMSDAQKAAFEECALENAEYFKSSQFRRIFNKIGKTEFAHGGRWYGHWIQSLYQKRTGSDGIPLKLRSKILINGKPTVELDYHCLHANMLYACCGIEPSYTDAYTVEGYEDLRNECKLAMLIVFNAKNEATATKALRKQIRESGGSYNYLKPGEIQSIFNGLKATHEPIKDFFFSGVGTRLQNIDSLIATKIIKIFMEREKPIIPIHDSFIVLVEDKELLRSTMLAQYRKILKTKNRIKID